MHASHDALTSSEPNLHNDTPLSPLSPHSLSGVTPIRLPKNRSAGNLYTRRGNAPDRARVRFSLDAAAPEFYSFSMSPLMTEHDQGLSMPGLRRARLHPPHRAPTLPPSLSSSIHSGAPQQSSHLTVSLPPSRAPSFSIALPSPTLNFTEVITQSPTESLHAFSFVQQTEDAIHNPQNALKISVDFLRDKMRWEAENSKDDTEQARTNGDYGVQSMTELFSRTELVPQEGIETDFGYPTAPLTCPAQITADNVFDKSFWPISPLLSRPGTPPHQSTPENSDSEESEVEGQPISLIAKELEEAASEPIANGSSEPKQAVERKNSAVEPVPEEKTKASRKKSTSAQDAEVIKKKSIAEFTILEEMGQGAYGQVKLARYKKSGVKVVLKYVTKRRILVDTWTRDRRLGTVPLEIHVLDYLRRDGLRHPNILEMSDFFEDDINYYIEMVPHGLPGMDLFDYIELRVNMEEEECRSIFVQIANAIHHLHTKALVVHRDIKDENVVLNSEGKVKLIDFGSAAYLKNGPFEVFVGTIDYAAPEVLAGRPYRGKEQDVWALGILLYTIIYKENPFYSIEEITDHDLRVPYVMSEESIDLVRLMLERNVEKRITIEQIMEHPWYKAHTPS